MPSRKSLLVFACAVLGLAAAGVYFAKRKPTSGSPKTDANPNAKVITAPPVNPQQPGQSDQSPDIALTTTSFLGTLTPGGTPEAAGRERNYVVTYQVAFLRKAPAEKLPEESLSYQQLMEKDSGQFPPYVFYGEIVRGTFDPAHTDTIAVRAKIDIRGKNDVTGHIDAQKLWLEPDITPVETPHYMALKDDTTIHVVPDATSPTALSIFQGEVFEAVGKLSFQGGQWIKARYNAAERPRYGFILANDVLALTPATVNQSAIAIDEVPRKTRHSDLSPTDPDRQKLSQTGFYVEAMPPNRVAYVDDMVESYENTSHGRQLFITSDLFLHAHHLIFDRMLQDLEEKKFAPSLTSLSSILAKTTETELKSLAAPIPPEVREALAFDLLYFSVAAKLFDPQFAIPESVRADAQVFVSKIQEAAGELPSNLTSKFGDEDFTQYKPRGHYELNETLKRYFRGTMWFGRRSFLLSSKNMTLAAILIPFLVDKAQETRAFESLDSSLGYLVGPQDKYSLTGYRSVNKKIYSAEAPGPSEVSFKLDDNLQAFARAVESDLPAPQIVSVQTGSGKTQEERLKMIRGFKFLGQRYTLDAFFFNQLTSPSVGTDANPRNLPSSLDVMMLLGSSAATEQQQQIQLQHKWDNYDSQTKKLQDTAYEHLSRKSNFYEDWLAILNSLFLPTPSKQLFALGKPWQYKNLNAGAASWTELKHDTVLYAEQSGAEMGEGDEFYIPPYDPPSPKGYVEPNPVFFHRQAQSIAQMLDRLKTSALVTEEYLDKFTTLRELARKAETVAQKEISGAAISSEDYHWIENVCRSFGPELLLPRGAEIISDPSQLEMALITDVATDNIGGQVLEVATGTPQRITVVVKDLYGGTRLTIGYVYSWYEFPSAKRWADSEWKKIVYEQDASAKKQNGIEPPSWYAIFSRN